MAGRWTFFSHHAGPHSDRSLFKSHAGPIQEAHQLFPGPSRLSSGRYNNEEFNFEAIGYWLRPHVVENGGREGLASANQSHRSHFFQWRRMHEVFTTPFPLSLFLYARIYSYTRIY